ncbi:ABC transporter permease [Bosea caraganae]|uniref:ABC transporter permease n=1 Tax=Bosea caraganae TaxID=2763117 RepID=A0A370L991_9HYPH|nr:ABC transporter permease [Bosea caraganae]RDJ26816.1 ABC transporter permease [Bosea caraganae]RDJ30702.1 ABC transporter permease [Bosea caraganae]
MAVTELSASGVEADTAKAERAHAIRRWLGNSGVVIGGSLFILILLATLVGPWLVQHDPFDQSLVKRLRPPVWSGGSWEFVFGTDHLGRDYLARLLWGGRLSLLIGFCTILVAGIFGTTIGICAGYFGGRIDFAVRFFIMVRLAMPAVLIALAIAFIAGPSLHLLVMVLGLLLWDRFAVVARATTLQLRNSEFVVAARAMGCSNLMIIRRDILPNILNQLIVIATVELANAVLIAAALSFLGLGVQPPLPDWGLMIAEGKQYILFSPYLITLPGLAMMLLVLAVNLLGDGIRDVTDPEAKGR